MPELTGRVELRTLSGDRLVDRLIVWTFGVAIASALLLTMSTVGNRLLLDGRIESVDGLLEASVWTWAASGATLAAGLAALVQALFFSAARLRFAGLGFLLLFFSLDDSLQVHETVGHRIRVTFDLPDYVGALWLLVYLPALAAIVWALVAIAREQRRSVRRAVFGGLALLGAGSALEALGVATKRLAVDGLTWPHGGRGVLEEATELAGVVLLAGALGAVLVASIEAFARRSDGDSEIALTSVARPSAQAQRSQPRASPIASATANKTHPTTSEGSKPDL